MSEYFILMNIMNLQDILVKLILIDVPWKLIVERGQSSRWIWSYKKINFLIELARIHNFLLRF